MRTLEVGTRIKWINQGDNIFGRKVGDLYEITEATAVSTTYKRVTGNGSSTGTCLGVIADPNCPHNTWFHSHWKVVGAARQRICDMTEEQVKEILYARHTGKSMEYWSDIFKEWRHTAAGILWPATAYRVKPEPVKPVKSAAQIEKEEIIAEMAKLKTRLETLKV